MSNTAVGGSHLLNSLGADHHDGRCLGNGRPMQESLEMKYDWGTFNSKLSPSEVGYVPPLEFSSELPEVNNPTVDSPCWKGAPVAYHPSFGIMKNADTPHSVKVAGSYNSSHQIEKAPEWSLKYPELFSKQHEISASECDHLKTFNLTVTRKNSEDHKEVPPVSVGDVGNYFPEEQHARGQKCYNSGEDFKNMITVTVGRQERPLPASKAKLLGPEESTQLHILTKGGQEQSHYYSASVGNMLKTSCESISKTRAVFLKQMYDLSVMILSTCNGGSSLQEYEEDLLQSVIQNLSASSRRSKAENMSGARNNLLMAMPEHSVVENTSKLKTFISQALAKLGEDKMLDDTDVSQLSIYKNLWIEAEASVCKLKYELQLARVKLATMKSHNNTQQVPVDSLEGNTDSISVIPNSKPENRAKESSACPVSLHYHGGDSGDMQPPAVNRSIIDGVDADVFARLEILRSCVDNVSSFGENNCKEQEQANKKQCRVEDAVMARLRVLNSRPDNTTSLKQENNHLLDVSTRADTIDDVVMSRLRILKFRPDNIPPLGEESSKHEPYASTNIPNEVDQAVMSRLRILKCRNDNLNSSVDVSKKNIETCTDRPNWDEDGSMAKMQALSCNTASIVEECQNILHSANFVNHLEGKGSVGGLDSFGDATCSDEGKGCKAASDEVNDKSAIQHGDGFATNIAWPQTAMDSHICTAGSQETAQISSPVHKYDMSPPGWEHVLKENFFHPGN
ncbi:hypothetical protein GUJ93_ZPchr0010g9432 [Zizania palustris]|uniref:Uncharacterized protein n=1 Tax=Zizania palustris TaxID=103762 RepID=A0A8J5VVU5_ZIZPA|nr:hypothetical protein GUJ93_ZPchr0010g9432 [Zizania palustris]